MPIYFFDIRDGSGVHPDDTGLELPDMAAAINEGRRALADMNREALSQTRDQPIEILIRDHGEGPFLLALAVTTEDLSPEK